MYNPEEILGTSKSHHPLFWKKYLFITELISRSTVSDNIFIIIWSIIRPPDIKTWDCNRTCPPVWLEKNL